MSDGQKPSKGPVVFDPDNWTGGDKPENYLFMARLAKDTVHAFAEASVMPAVFLATKLAGGTVGNPAALAVFAYSHYMRTRATLEAKYPNVEIVPSDVMRQTISMIVDELREAGVKTAVEWSARDKNRDGKVSLREYIEAVADITGNFLPGDRLRGPVLDAAETAASWLIINDAANYIGQNQDLNKAGKALAVFGVSLPIVTATISVSKRDEKWLDNLAKTKIGSTLYDWLGFDGKVGPGNDSYAAAYAPPLITPKGAGTKTVMGITGA